MSFIMGLERWWGKCLLLFAGSMAGTETLLEINRPMRGGYSPQVLTCSRDPPQQGIRTSRDNVVLPVAEREPSRQPSFFPWFTSYLDPLGFNQVALSKPGPLIE